MANEIHVGDVGSVFEITLSDNNGVITEITNTKCIIFKKENSVVLTRPAVYKTDGSDGILQYTTVEGDLDIAGQWSIQARVLLISGIKSSNIDTFTVYPNLDPLPVDCIQ